MNTVSSYKRGVLETFSFFSFAEMDHQISTLVLNASGDPPTWDTTYDNENEKIKTA